MRGVIIAGLILVGAAESPAAARAQPPHLVRTAQLITMDASRSEPERTDRTERVPTDVAPLSEPVAGDLPLSAEFRVHDLSRRWVEYQMAGEFAAPQPAINARSDDPFAPIGVAQPQVPAFDGALAPVSTISVPAWMRGGSLFAAAAATYVPGCLPAEYRPSGFLSVDAEYRRRGYYDLMASIACQYGIPVGLFDAMIIRESRYNASIYSPKKAFGLTQLMPGTASGLGINRYDVEQNLRGGARYLRQQLDHFGQYHLALAAYNAGPGRVRRGAVPAIPETQDYVSNVLLNWSKLSGLSHPNRPEMLRSARSVGHGAARAAVVTSF